MPSVNKNLIMVLLLIVGLLGLAGCGSEKNDNSVFDEDQHPAGWLPAGHMAAAKADETVCAQCHGSDYAGGVSGVSCTRCHLGGVNSVHPAAWGSAVAMNHGQYVAASGNTACANAVCHGTTLSGVDQSGPSCTSCHMGGVGSFHPASWGTGSQVILNHAPYAQTNGTGQCSNASCHGTTLQGGVGPACASCHQSGSPFTGCTSCHNTPPAGSVAPNRTGAHNTSTGHFAAQVTLPDGCNTCHNNAGTGTLLHDNGVIDVQFLSAYSAKSGTAVHNADGTCSNVSCHGGQTTPVWLTGTIDVSTQCISCHSFGTTQYNSFVSGQHYFHVVLTNIDCNACHDVSKLTQSHFKSLNTSTMEGPASATIQDFVGYNPDTATCSLGCHSPRVW